MKKIIDSFRQVGIILAFLLSTTIMFAQQKSDRSRKKRTQ